MPMPVCLFKDVRYYYYFYSEKERHELKQFTKEQQSRVMGNEGDTAATCNAEPEYDVIDDSVRSTGDYDIVKCPAYDYVSNK